MKADWLQHDNDDQATLTAPRFGLDDRFYGMQGRAGDVDASASTYSAEQVTAPYPPARRGEPATRPQPLSEDAGDVTLLLRSAQSGDAAAMNEALSLMYAALHRLAAAQLHQNSSERTLSPTALVNEAYLKLFGERAPVWENRGHLLGVAARAMREVLIDAARRRKAAKRPQDCDRIDLSKIAGSVALEVDYVGLLDCLEALEQLDPRQASIVSMRFFLGLNAEQIGTALEISPVTVQREWRLARAWLQRELQS